MKANTQIVYDKEATQQKKGILTKINIEINKML